ncbi:hypothetical protein ACXIVK_00340 [Paraburkholderia caledonica]
MLLPATRIGTLDAFEPPKGANAAYYNRFAAELSGLQIVGNGRDIRFGYPPIGSWIHGPGDMLWLTSTGFQILQTNRWPRGLSLSDPSVDLVVQRLEALAAAPVKPAA